MTGFLVCFFVYDRGFCYGLRVCDRFFVIGFMYDRVFGMFFVCDKFYVMGFVWQACVTGFLVCFFV